LRSLGLAVDYRSRAGLPARQSSSRGRGVCHSTILIVDDEDAVRIALRRQLTAQGHTVLEASHGIEALALVRMQEGRVELVLADVVMPEMNGTELAATLQTEYPDLPVILMSAYAPRLDAGRHPRVHRAGPDEAVHQ
jgi:two-component system, cell cycle sensor histidine kinase and response regulator CckA